MGSTRSTNISACSWSPQGSIGREEREHFSKWNLDEDIRKDKSPCVVKSCRLSLKDFLKSDSFVSKPPSPGEASVLEFVRNQRESCSQVLVISTELILIKTLKNTNCRYCKSWPGCPGRDFDLKMQQLVGKRPWSFVAVGSVSIAHLAAIWVWRFLLRFWQAKNVLEGRSVGEESSGDAPGGPEVCEDPWCPWQTVQCCHTRYLAPT